LGRRPTPINWLEVLLYNSPHNESDEKNYSSLLHCCINYTLFGQRIDIGIKGGVNFFKIGDPRYPYIQ
jgi:hypothetical protein